jgi:hypothetical protein
MATIDMVPVKAKLSGAAYDQDVERVFVQTLVSRMNDRLAPIGIAMQFELFMYDLAKGKSGLTKPIPPELFGYPPMLYAVLATNAKLSILDAVHEEHKEAVRTAFDDIRKG